MQDSTATAASIKLHPIEPALLIDPHFRIETLPAVLYWLALRYVPESPRWLAIHGDDKGALQVLGRTGARGEEALAAIKQLLPPGQRPATAPRGPNVAGKIFDLGDNPVKGDDGAKIALLEFTDYQCPFCYRHTTQTQPQIEREYIDAGKIRYVSLEMPSPNRHPLAVKAS